jgi:rhomboid protease GluP
MRKLLRYLAVRKGKREQDELGAKEITPADRVRAAQAKREQDESPVTSINVDASGDAELQDASGDAELQDASGDVELQVAEFYAQLKRFTPYAFVTPALVLINVAVFVAMIAAGVDLMSPSIEHILSWGANYAPMTTGGEWWRLLTSNYLHIGIIHIAFNMYVLWDAGRLVERLLGNIGFIIMYVLSGIFGSFTTILWNPVVVSAGASGAVFGVYGCLVGFLLLSRGSIPNKVLKHIGLSALVFVAYNVFYAIGEEGIDMAAHIGGLATGFLCGVIMRLPLASGSVNRRWVGNGIVGGIGAAVIALAIGNGLGHVADVRAALLRFGQVEERVGAKFDDTMQKAQFGELSDAQVSLIIDQQILIPLRAARVAFETMDDVPIQQKPLVDKSVTYMNLREDAWRLLSDAIKTGDERMANSFAEKMQEADQLVEQIISEHEETE